MKFKPLFVVLAFAALLSAGALSACGGSDDKTSTSASQSSSGGNDTGADVSSTSSFLSEEDVSKAFDQFKEKAGSKAKLHSVEVKPDEVAFEYTENGKTADGFVWTKETLELEPIEVEEFGSGTIPSYPVDDFDPAAPGKINDELEKMGYELASMALQNTSSTKPQWSVQANKGEVYGYEFVASAGGSGLKKTKDGSKAPEAPSPDEAQKQAECLQKAGGDVKKVQECTK